MALKKVNTIGIDFDGTITEYYNFQDSLLKEKYNIEVKNYKTTNFKERYGLTQEELNYNEMDYIKEYFNNVKLKENVKETIEYLKNRNIKIYIITNRKKERYNYIKNYLDKHNIYYDKIICLGHSNEISKLEKLLEYKVDLMIEDNVKQIESISKELSVIYIKDKYNETIKGKNIISINNWREIKNIIK